MNEKSIFQNLISLIQGSDNFQYIQQINQLSTQNRDLQKENSELRDENEKLKHRKKITNRVVRHQQPYITLKNDPLSLYYCAHCWDSQQLRIQLNIQPKASFSCPHCGNVGKITDN